MRRLIPDCCAAKGVARHLWWEREQIGGERENIVLTGAKWQHPEQIKEARSMRRPGHIRERSPGSFEIRYTLGTDPANGKRKTATATVRGSRKDADRELRRLLKLIDDGAHVESSRLALKQWLRIWLESVKSEVSPKTHERYEQIVDRYLIPKLGNLPIAKLSSANVQIAYNELASDPRRDGRIGSLSARTRHHIHRVLSGALNRAVEQGIIGRNPTDAFRKRLPKVEPRGMAVLTPDQSAMLLAAPIHPATAALPARVGL
jgi:hypothetical protein